MNANSTGAFFDMDRTVLRGSSGRLFLKYLFHAGYLNWQQWVVISCHVARYAVGPADFPRLMASLMKLVAATREAEAWRLSDAWFEASLRLHIADRARERITWHQGQGHRTAIVSAATQFAVAPVADSLRMDYLATRLEVVDGRLTGAYVEPPCYGAGKVALAMAYAADHGLDLAASYFYSDSYRDLPLLEAVGHPVAVNPDRRLARTAAQRNWPVLTFY